MGVPGHGVIALVVLIGIPLVLAGAADAGPADVTVTGIQLNPSVLMRGDTASATITVLNGGTTPVAVRRAFLVGEPMKVQPLNNPYDTVGDIGAGTSREFSFQLKAEGPDGTYYPRFSLDFRDAGSLTIPFPVTVRSTTLAVSVLNRPDRFSRERKDSVTLLIGNPRINEVTGVTLLLSGEGLEITPSRYFIGTLKPDASTTVSFKVTPARAGDLLATVSYQNGANLHEEEITLPIVVDDDLKRATLVASNLVLTRDGKVYRLTGDVSNAGLEVASAVTVTVGGDAVPVDPYRSYVVGSLNPDDFASFEVSFQAGNATSAILILQFKDRDGRVFSGTTQVPLALAAGTAQGTPPPLPWLILIPALALAVAALIIYSWKRKR